VALFREEEEEKNQNSHPPPGACSLLLHIHVQFPEIGSKLFGFFSEVLICPRTDHLKFQLFLLIKTAIKDRKLDACPDPFSEGGICGSSPIISTKSSRQAIKPWRKTAIFAKKKYKFLNFL